MQKKILPPLQCLEIKHDSDTNLYRAIFATIITLLFLAFGGILYHFTFPYLEDKPILILFLVIMYIPFQIGVMLFSVYFVDQIELFIRRFNSK